MNELIKVVINENNEQIVSARELHEFLEIGRDFSNWFKDRVEKYSFEEGEDYSPILANSTKSAPRPKKEYMIKMDTAKELAMVENNEKGRQARKYFIQCEKKLKETTKVPTTLKEALQLALEQQEKLEKQQLAIQEKSKIIKEKVEVIDNLTEDVDSVLLRKIATDYVSKKAKETSKPHPEIWGDIYGLFGRELKINLANRFDKYKQEQYDLIAFNLHYNKVNNLKGEDKKTPYTKKEIKKLSKVEYICKVLKKGGLLIEIMAKVFEIPTEDIIGKYKDYEFDDTREIILIDGSNY